MLDHIIGVGEASELWDLSQSIIEDLCVQQLIVSKKINGTWIIFRNQNPSRVRTKGDAEELSKKIEWDLMSPQEHIAILDQNTRIFNSRVHLLRSLRSHAKKIEEDVLRDMFDHLSDEEYAEIKAAADEIDS